MKSIVKTGIVGAAVVVWSWMASHAMIAVFWFHSEGFYKSDGVTPLLGGPAPSNTYAQLIFTPTPTYDPVDPFAPNYVSGDDVMLDDVIVDTTVSPYGEINGGVYTGAYMAGYLFLRVFDQYGHLGLTNGMWYYDSPMTNTIDNLSDPYFPDEANFALMTPEFGDVLNKQVVVIPEPASWATMLLGATLLVGRKLRRK